MIGRNSRKLPDIVNGVRGNRHGVTDPASHGERVKGLHLSFARKGLRSASDGLHLDCLQDEP